MKRKAILAGSVAVIALGWAAITVAAPKHGSDFDAIAALHARTMLEEGRKTFRFDTFGSEAFWGDALQMHKAVAGEKNGGVGPGVSPKTALAVGQADRSPAHMYRTAPLAGLWSHQKGGFYHDGRFATLLDVVDHYDKQFKLKLSDKDKTDLVEYLKGI